jgi:hypothetical protein
MQELSFEQKGLITTLFGADKEIVISTTAILADNNQLGIVIELIFNPHEQAFSIVTTEKYTNISCFTEPMPRHINSDSEYIQFMFEMLSNMKQAIRPLTQVEEQACYSFIEANIYINPIKFITALKEKINAEYEALSRWERFIITFLNFFGLGKKYYPEQALIVQNKTWIEREQKETIHLSLVSANLQ